jgi:hypothetical protein
VVDDGRLITGLSPNPQPLNPKPFFFFNPQPLLAGGHSRLLSPAALKQMRCGTPALTAWQSMGAVLVLLQVECDVMDGGGGGAAAAAAAAVVVVMVMIPMMSHRHQP